MDKSGEERRKNKRKARAGDAASNPGKDGAAPSGITISGAEQVGVGPGTRANRPAGFAVTPAELQHWSDAPTGQVPAVVARDLGSEGQDPWAQMPVPSWREGEEDWASEESTLEISSLQGEHEMIGANATSDAIERAPWEFDINEAGARGDDREDIWEFTSASSTDTEHAETTESPSEVTVPTAVDIFSKAMQRTSEFATLAHPHHFSVRIEGDPTGSSIGDTASIGSDATTRVVEPTRNASQVRHRRAILVDTQATKRNIPLAVGTGVGLGAAVLAFFYFGTVPAMAVVTVAVTLAAAEALAALRSGGLHPASPLALLGVAGAVIATYNEGTRAIPAILIVAVVATVVWQLIGVDRRAEPMSSTFATLFVVAWIGVFGSYAGLLLSPSAFPHRHGVAFLLCAIVSTVGADVGALIIGKWKGKHPLSKSSPNKTWEGLIGGAIVACVAGLAFGHATHPLDLQQGLYIGIAASVLVPVGDLTESMVKRFLEVKDMGRLLPGHGGVLDRVDGLLFVLPATYYLVELFHLS